MENNTTWHAMKAERKILHTIHAYMKQALLTHI